MSQTVTKAIYDKLATTGSGTFSEAVGGRIYELLAPANNATFPLAVFNVVVPAVQVTFTGKIIHAFDFQVDLYGKLSVGIASLAAAQAKLVTLLNQTEVTVGDSGSGTFEVVSESRRSIEDQYIRLSTDFRLRSG